MIPTPYVAAAVLLALGGSFFYGMNIGEDRAIAKAAEAKALVESVQEKAYRGAIQAIDEKRPVHKTIQVNAKEIIRENVVYRDCVHSPAVTGLLDAARANQAPAGSAARLPSESRQGESP